MGSAETESFNSFLFSLGRVQLLKGITVKLFAIDPDATFDYVIEAQKKSAKEDQVIFLIKVLTLKEMLKVEKVFKDLASAQEQNTDSSLEQVEEFLHKGLELVLKGWKNLQFQNGKFCDYNEYKDRILDVLNMGVASQVLSGAMELNTLQDEDKGN